MATNKKYSTMNDVKKQLSKSRCSVNSIKDVARKRFRDRLKQLRLDNLYNVRNIKEQVDKLKNLRNSLSIDGSFLTPSEIIELLDEVEIELKLDNNNTQCDEYVNDTNLIFEELMMGVEFCPICEKILESINSGNNICNQCSESFNM